MPKLPADAHLPAKLDDVGAGVTSRLASLAMRIRTLRAQRGMTRKQLAAQSGVSLPYLARVEAGTGNVSLAVLHKLAEALNVGVETLVAERTAKYDPGNDYSINYMWGTVGIGYNVEKVKAALGVDHLDSWDVVFNPETMKKLSDCGVHFLDSPTDVIPSVLKYLGLDPEDNSPENLQKVEDVLLKVRPYVRKFHSSEYINGLANGDICVAIGWSGDVFQARDRAAEAKQGVEIAYTIPKEGAEMWFDQMAIPADAPHVADALEFLNYMMRPEVIAKSTNYVYYASGNKAAQEFVNKDILEDPTIYPDDETMQKLFTVTPPDPKTQRLITRTWTKVVTGQ